MTKLYNYLTLLLIAIYVFYINYINRLAFFVHPRYIAFTLICGGIIGVAGIAGIVHTFRTSKTLLKESKSFFSVSFVILIATLFVFLIPVKSLSSESFALRTSNSGLNNSEGEKDKIRLKLKGGVDSLSFKFFDWVSAKNLNENGIFKDKKFKGVGFISVNKEANTFDLSRFVISCCVVDATPVSLLVEYDYQKQFKANDWVEVEGTFVIKIVGGKSQPVIIPISVTKVPEPDFTYLDRT